MKTEQPPLLEDREFASKHTRILAAFKSGQSEKINREEVANDPRLLGDKEIMILTVSILGGDLLENAPEHIRDDAEIVFRACTNTEGNPLNSTWELSRASDRLKSDVALIKRIVEETPWRSDSVEGVRRNVPLDVWNQVKNSFRRKI